MSPWWSVLGSVALVSGVPFALVAMLAASGRRLPRLVAPLVGLGAGALAGTAVFHLLPEATARHPAGPFVGVLAVLGLFGSHLAERGLHRWQETSHDAEPREPGGPAATDDPAMTAVNFAADGLHNMMDGALVAASWMAGGTSGTLTTLAVLAHELPRELGTFGVFVHYGTSPWRAVAYNAATGGLALLGATLTLLLGGRVTAVAEALVPIAAGAFLYVAGAVMLSQRRAHRAGAAASRQVMAAALGFALSAVAAIWR